MFKTTCFRFYIIYIKEKTKIIDVSFLTLNLNSNFISSIRVLPTLYIYQEKSISVKRLSQIRRIKKKKSDY